MNLPLAQWYEAAGVRTQERRVLHEDREIGLALFPERLVPYLGHELLAGADDRVRQALLARHLYQYLLFTVHLETKVVNRGVSLVMHGELDMEIPERTRLDAAKIYCDEGYHALYSLDIVQQIAVATAIPTLPYDFTPRMRRLERTAHRYLPEHPRLAQLLQVVAFETVVTAILSEIPRDETVYRVVRDVVADHARDEAHHHAFFAKFFHEVWASLPARLRAGVARSLPHFVNDCLRPDLGPIRDSLAAVGHTTAEIEEILRESYSEDVMRAAVRANGRYTLRLCESVGALDLPGVRDELHGLGLA